MATRIKNCPSGVGHFVYKGRRSGERTFPGITVHGEAHRANEAILSLA